MTRPPIRPTRGTTICALTLPEATGGVGTLTYSLTPRVPGLSFDPTTRQLTGTPMTVGGYAMNYTMTEADADTDTDTLSFTITVRAQATQATQDADLGECAVGMLVRPGQS